MGAKRTQWEGVMRCLFTATVALLIAATSARAEPLPTQRFLPTSVAVEAALAAFDHCVSAGHHVSVEVMTHNAMILVALHHELATIHSSYSAHAKAYTVLSYSFASGETTSGEIARRITKNPADVARIQGDPWVDPGGGRHAHPVRETDSGCNRGRRLCWTSQ
jgi:uncharacterized protein GlcG (DUF336 family)